MKNWILGAVLALFMALPAQAQPPNYGATHALACAGAVVGVNELFDWLAPYETTSKNIVKAVVGGSCVAHFYNREKRARGDKAFSDWGVDSQLDATLTIPAVFLAWQIDF